MILWTIIRTDDRRLADMRYQAASEGYIHLTRWAHPCSEIYNTQTETNSMKDDDDDYFSNKQGKVYSDGVHILPTCDLVVLYMSLD
jgi:hypothetical protein